MAEKKDKNPPKKTTGTITPVDEELTEWLHRLWDLKEQPESIAVYQAFARNKITRGERIFIENFKPNQKLDREDYVLLANRIIAAAQHDCDCIRQEQHYLIIATDIGIGSEPTVRRLGPLLPKRHYLQKNHLATAAAINESEEDKKDFADQNFRFAELTISKVQFEQQRADAHVNNAIKMYQDITADLREENAQLRAANIALFNQAQQAQDESLRRQNDRLWLESKRQLFMEGMRFVKNLAPGLIASAHQGNGQGQGEGQGNGQGEQSVVDKMQIQLVTNFLQDCKDTGVDIQLFGDWQEQDGKMTCVSPGIFRPEQVAILLRVRKGAPLDTLDNLIPNCGKPEAITDEQIMKAMQIVSPGVGSSMIELLGIRAKINQGQG